MARKAAQQQTPVDWERDIRLRRNDLALITRQLGVMLEAGISLRKALEVLSEGAVDENCGVVLQRLLKCTESGWKLSSSMAAFPRVFARVYVAMVEVGEETGQLVRTLHNLALWLEGEEGLIRQVRGALTYPGVVLAAAALLTVGFFTVIFPGFAESLKTVPKLPLLTTMLIEISETLRSPLFWLALLLFTVVGLQMARRGLTRPQNQLGLWRLLSGVPLLSPLLRDLGASRLASAMAILLQTGVDILKSFRLASVASGNPLVLSYMEEGLQHLSHGGDLADFMKQHPDAYPAMMAGLVLVGQESASLPRVFEKLQRSLNEDCEYRLEILTALLEPLLMAFVSVLVGLLVIGIAMPMYGLVNGAL